MHGGGELASALTAHLKALRQSAHEALEEPPAASSAKKAPTFGAETLTSAVNTVHRFLLGHVPRRPEAPAAPPGDVPAAAATGADDTPPPATPSQQQQQTARGLPVADVERLGGLAKSVLEHIQGKLAAAAAMAEKK